MWWIFSRYSRLRRKAEQLKESAEAVAAENERLRLIVEQQDAFINQLLDLTNASMSFAGEQHELAEPYRALMELRQRPHLN
jgi:hypothetical protein